MMTLLGFIIATIGCALLLALLLHLLKKWRRWRAERRELAAMANREWRPSYTYEPASSATPAPTPKASFVKSALPVCHARLSPPARSRSTPAIPSLTTFRPLIRQRGDLCFVCGGRSCGTHT